MTTTASKRIRKQDADRYLKLVAEGHTFTVAAAPFHPASFRDLAKRDDEFREREEEARRDQANARRTIVDDKMHEWALADDASDRMKEAWARRWVEEYHAPSYRRLEIEDGKGGRLSLETNERSASVAEVATVLARALGRAGHPAPHEALPAAREVLPEPGDD